MAQSQASVPPAPEWTSKIQSNLSYGPLSNSNKFSFSTSCSIELTSCVNCSSVLGSLSISNKSNNSRLSLIFVLIVVSSSTVVFFSLISFNTFSADSRSFQKFPCSVLLWSSFISWSFESMSKWPP